MGKVSTVMNENLIYKISTPHITILDSQKLLNTTKAKVLEDFNTGYKLMECPGDLATEYNLFFNGYINRSYTDLSITKKDNTYIKFSMEEKSIQYLRNNLEGLFSAIQKFSTIIYDKYTIDITKCTTISSLSYKIFLTNFYKTKDNVKVIGGIVEKDIRNAHYGGVTAINQNHATNVFYYDMNSQYPSAMRNPMPVGNPTLHSNIDLDNSFGFIYAHILVPDNQMSLIPYRTELGVIEYPSTDFSGWYFSEELKALKLLNYQIKVEGGYIFENSSSVFTSFVEKIYHERISAKKDNNHTIANIIKLLLNSLYGKTGMNSINTFSKIIHNDDLQSFDIQYTVIKHIHLPNDYTLVVAHNQQNIELIELLNSTINSTKPMTTGKYTQSSVPLAAAISSYARISMHPFKTLAENDWIYSDTDSIILEKELDQQWVSPYELGKMKLEYNVKEVFYLGPKFYAMVISGQPDQVIIKCAGIDSQQLSLEIIQQLMLGIEKKVNAEVMLKKYDESNAVFVVNRNITLKFNPKYNITPRAWA